MLSHIYGRRKDFIQGGAVGDFPKIFSTETKSGEVSFCPSKLKKQPFFANNFKIRHPWLHLWRYEYDYECNRYSLVTTTVAVKQLHYFS